MQDIYGWIIPDTEEELKSLLSSSDGASSVPEDKELTRLVEQAHKDVEKCDLEQWRCPCDRGWLLRLSPRHNTIQHVECIPCSRDEEKARYAPFASMNERLVTMQRLGEFVFAVPRLMDAVMLELAKEEADRRKQKRRCAKPIDPQAQEFFQTMTMAGAVTKEGKQ